MKKPLVVVLVGPTASGKTRLAVELAKRMNGEIVSGDSMQIYRGMDVGTAKPTEQERAGIPHHLIDVRDPQEEYTLKQFLDDADRCVRDILSRGKLPILAGGTGLYISSFLHNLRLSEETEDPEYRAWLENEYDIRGGEALLNDLRVIDPTLAEKLHAKDRKRILRGLEVFHNTGVTQTQKNREALGVESPYDFLIFGLTAEKREFLYDRIDRRVTVMLSDGLEGEARKILASSCSRTARQAIGYREFEPYFRGEIPLEQVADQIRQESRNYAKRQLTWFRREKEVRWFEIDRLNFDIILNFCVGDIDKRKEI